QIAKFIRGHWQVENSLHWLKDRYWREDKHKLRKPGLGMIYASLTNLAVSVLQLLPGKASSKNLMPVVINQKNN
ncbi:MAG: transposase, partial [Planctomycetaceae bacterium]|nr:transposase [Planctomycetaceae bacterium]